MFLQTSHLVLPPCFDCIALLPEMFFSSCPTPFQVANTSHYFFEVNFLCEISLIAQGIRLQCWGPWFNFWVGKIPWRRERLPTPVFFWRSPWTTVHGVAKSRTWLSNFRFHFTSFVRSSWPHVVDLNPSHLSLHYIFLAYMCKLIATYLQIWLSVLDYILFRAGAVVYLSFLYTVVTRFLPQSFANKGNEWTTTKKNRPAFT